MPIAVTAQHGVRERLLLHLDNRFLEIGPTLEMIV
jgi:hypothetical protein